MKISAEVLGLLFSFLFECVSSQLKLYQINVSYTFNSSCSIEELDDGVSLKCGSLMNGLLRFHNYLPGIDGSNVRLQITMDGGNYTVNNSYQVLDFVSIHQVSLESTSKTHITCDSKSGFLFYDIVEMSMSNIIITNCTTGRNTTYINTVTGMPDIYRVSIAFVALIALSLNNVTIHTCAGETAIAIYNTQSAKLINSTFKSSSEVRQNVTYYIKSSTLLIELTYCSYYIDRNPQCNVNNAQGNSFSMTGCVVSHNKAVSAGQDKYNSKPIGSRYRTAGRGGGMAILIKGNCNSNNFDIRQSEISSNSANQGSGLYIGLMDDTYDNQIVIQGSIFDCNHSPNDPGSAKSTVINTGGGVTIDNFVSLDTNAPNTITIVESHFENNSATSGGGIFLHSIDTSTVSLVLLVKESLFNNSQAKLGSAVYVLQPHNVIFTDSVNVSFQDTNFTNNFIVYKDNVSSGGYGAVYSYMTRLDISRANFVGNNGSALVLMNAYANFSGVGTFKGNCGLQGGAIALLGTSYLYFNSGTHIDFAQNIATYQGGAVYKEYPVDVMYGAQFMPCFLQYEDSTLSLDQWKVKLHFNNNSQLNDDINSIYATSILPCGNLAPIMTESKLSYHHDQSPSIATAFAPNHFSPINFTLRPSPGRHFDISIDIQDDLNQSSTIAGQSFIVTYFKQENVMSTEVKAIDQLLINGSINDSFRLTLDSIEKPTLHIEVNVILQECPLGFVNVNESCLCPGDEIRELNCTNEKHVVVLKENSWIGEYNGDIYVATCPIFYCQTHTNGLELPHTYNDLSSIICAGNRSGLLCGKCMDGFMPAINSWQLSCVKCKSAKDSKTILAYYVAAYAPYLVMMAVIVVFNIRLTAGPASTFVMYAQMVTTTFDASIHGLVQNYPEKALNTYRYIYGPLNLNFIENFIPPLCFSSYNTLLPVLGQLYLLLAIPMVIVMISVISKLLITRIGLSLGPVQRFWNVLKGSKLFKWAPKSFTEVHILAISTIITLSFLKLCIISSFILSTTKLTKLGSSGNTSSMNFVAFAAEVPINSSSYRIFQTPAIILEILAIFFIILLLDFPLRLVEYCIHKIGFLRRIYPEIIIHSFVSTFNRLYKKKYRIFAGLNFLMRHIFSLVFVISSKSYIKFTLQSIICFLMILLLFFCWPYKNVKHNYIDLFLLSNLIILNGLGFYQYVNFFLASSHKLTKIIFSAQYIFTVSPLVFVFGYCIFKITQYRHNEWAEDIHFTASGLVRKWSPSLHQKIFTSNLDENEDHQDSIVASEHTNLTRSSQHNPVRNVQRIERLVNLSTTSNEVEVDYSPSVPVTVIGVEDKHEGEATTYQTSHAEGFFLRSEWNPSVYGSINNSYRAETAKR